MTTRGACFAIAIIAANIAAIFAISPVWAGVSDLNSGNGSGSDIVTSVPRVMNYQGILNDSAGDPVADSIYNMTFRIFDTDIGGTALWEQTTPCTTSSGIFYAVFNNVNLPFDTDYWLEIEVGSEILDPRQKMGMSAYAAVADTADFAHSSASSGWVDDGTVVRLESDADSVGIGTATPTEKLHVEGNLYVSGTATIGTGHTVSGSNNFIAGTNHSGEGDNSVIGGGSNNYFENSYTTIGGGQINEVTGPYGTVGGGSHNSVGGYYGSIAGGSWNQALDTASVGGGSHNFATGTNSFIGGGSGNASSSLGSTVGGGASNSALANYSTVTGGLSNTASIAYGFVGGGHTNNIGDGQYAVIAGGDNNSVEGDMATVGGGAGNEGHNDYATVGGGNFNSVGGPYGTIGGGRNNTVQPFSDATIGGGRNNTTSANDATISGGYGNSAGDGSTVAGGGGNMATGYSSVGGGEDNSALTEYSTVSGGYNNYATEYCAVGGGSYNSAQYDGSTVSGGMHNTTTGYMGTISGGMHNYVAGDYAYIAGGYADTIEATGDFSFLFGIGSKLTQDSTFMVDMPRIQFGDEASGYKFPTVDGTSGQVMETDGAGQLNWADLPPNSGWIDDGTVVRLQTESNLVGIGTSAPSTQLDVNGTVKMNGFRMTTGAQDGYVLTCSGGNGYWSVAPNISGSGVTNTVPRFTDSTTLTSSMIYQNGSYVGLGTATPVTALTVNGGITQRTTAGLKRAEIVTNTDNSGSFTTFGANGSKNTEATNIPGDPDRGAIYVMDASGNDRAGMQTLTTGAGYVYTKGVNGNLNVVGTHLSGYVNNGYIGVQDYNGSTRAGMYVSGGNIGTIFGDTKSFREANPDQPGTDIWYTCPEGPEAAAYIRGTGHLENGRAEIIYPDHFKAVMSLEGMTVQLSPLSAESMGLAAVEKRADRVIVRELSNGTGSYDFSYTIMAVRKGYENYRVIRPSLEVQPAIEDVSMKPTQE